MNLTKTSIFIKKFFKYLLIFASGYYLFTLVIFPGSVAIIRKILYREPEATLTYGLMDQLEFVEKPIGNTTPEYVLNTKNGKLPQNLPGQMKIFKFKPQPYSYLAGTNAISDAEKIGFTQADLISDLKGEVYTWRNTTTTSNLSININNRDIVLTTNLSGKNSSFNPGSLNQDRARDFAKNILSSILRFNDDLYPKGTQTVRLGNYVGNKIYETTEIKVAQLALVDFYRSMGNYPILGPDPSKGLLRIVVRNPSGNKGPLNNPLMEVYYKELMTTSNATYPIISVKDAWDVIRSGKGIIASVVPKGSNPFEVYTKVDVEKILINNIFLAYYETPKYQGYLQSIYVFAGAYTTRGTQGGEIVIYFPAIAGQYTKQNQPDAME